MSSDFATSLRVSARGLSAQRMRMNAISSNIANINTTKTPEGGPYRRKDVVFEAMPDSRNFGELVTSSPNADIQRVQATDVIPDPKGVDLRYEPDNPDANPEGYVAYPKINLMEEMANMIQATRGYEANVAAIQASKDMALGALEIGR
jgi:flagellar basal-body rod protein FlgC